MKINDRNLGPIRPVRPATEGREKDAPSKDLAAKTLPVDNNRADRVELSDAARQLAKQAIQQLRTRAPQKSGDGQPAESAPGILPPNKDHAQFSVAARALVKDVVQALPADAKDRLQQVRQRIIGGAYDIDHVVSEVARRIIERGDL